MITVVVIVIAGAMDTSPPVPPILRPWDSVGTTMDGKDPSARLCDAVMLTHVANMANVAMTSVTVTMAVPVMIVMMKFITRLNLSLQRLTP